MKSQHHENSTSVRLVLASWELPEPPMLSEEIVFQALQYVTLCDVEGVTKNPTFSTSQCKLLNLFN